MHELKCKIVLAGNSGVGKSNLLSRFTRDEFNFDTRTTIGVGFDEKLLKIGDKKVRLEVWDTAGHEKFRAITPAYYRSSNGVVLVFDVTKYDSFDRLEWWLTQIKEQCPENVDVILVANKADLNHLRKVDTEKGRKFAEERNLLFIETSSLEGTNVHQTFTMLAEKIVGNQSLPNSSTIDDSVNAKVENLELGKKTSDVNTQSKCC